MSWWVGIRGGACAEGEIKWQRLDLVSGTESGKGNGREIGERVVMK